MAQNIPSFPHNQYQSIIGERFMLLSGVILRHAFDVAVLLKRRNSYCDVATRAAALHTGDRELISKGRLKLSN